MRKTKKWNYLIKSKMASSNLGKRRSLNVAAESPEEASPMLNENGNGNGSVIGFGSIKDLGLWNKNIQ